MKTLVIDRGQWLTGTALTHLGNSGTLRDKESGLMCCLGFVCEKDRVFRSEMEGKSFPQDVAPGIYDDEHWLSKPLAEEDKKHDPGGNLTVAGLLAGTNDGNLHAIRKEAKIKKLFKKYGDIDVTFTGRYAEATSKARKVAKSV